MFDKLLNWFKDDKIPEWVVNTIAGVVVFLLGGVLLWSVMGII